MSSSGTGKRNDNCEQTLALDRWLEGFQEQLVDAADIMWASRARVEPIKLPDSLRNDPAEEVGLPIAASISHSVVVHLMDLGYLVL